MFLSSNLYKGIYAPPIHWKNSPVFEKKDLETTVWWGSPTVNEEPTYLLEQMNRSRIPVLKAENHDRIARSFASLLVLVLLCPVCGAASLGLHTASCWVTSSAQVTLMMK